METLCCSCIGWIGNRDYVKTISAFSAAGFFTGIRLGCAGPSHMVKSQTAFPAASIKAVPGKAALVIARTEAKGWNGEFFNYLGKNSPV